MKNFDDMERTPADACKTSAWYQALSSYTFPSSFIKLKPFEIQALADGQDSGKIVADVVERLRAPMKACPGNCFVFVDTAAPTDTERFEKKRGAVYSPASAWKVLAGSEKVRKAVSSGQSDFICIRPFRRMSKPREFRLFIYKGRLSAMSQYWLIRHFRRLHGVKNIYWEKAEKFVQKISWLLPHPTIVMDVYFTAGLDIMIVDFNPWGPPTPPLLLRDWERNWAVESGIQLIPPPTMISGEVNVSF